MAKQKGIFRVNGSIGDVTFVTGRQGDIVKKKSSITRERVMTDPCFAAMRENMAEFGIASKSAATLHNALLSLSKRAKDSTMHNRLSGVMKEIRDLDLLSGKGKRSAGAAIEQNPAVASLLCGFEFNDRTHLSQLLSCRPQVDLESGAVMLHGLDLGWQLRFPKVATHAFVTSGWVRVDLSTHETRFSASEAVILPLNSPVRDVALVPQEAPCGSGITVVLLRIGFSQVMNGRFYPLADAGWNALGIVGVSA